MRKTLSIAMIAMNEESNLPRTLESVKWADEIVIVDSGSTDRTIEIAKSFGARTSYHAFGGHGETVEKTADFAPAFERALAAGKPAIIHVKTDAEALTSRITLTQLREQSLERLRQQKH